MDLMNCLATATVWMSQIDPRFVCRVFGHWNQESCPSFVRGESLMARASLKHQVPEMCSTTIATKMPIVVSFRQKTCVFCFVFFPPEQTPRLLTLFDKDTSKPLWGWPTSAESFCWKRPRWGLTMTATKPCVGDKSKDDQHRDKCWSFFVSKSPKWRRPKTFDETLRLCMQGDASLKRVFDPQAVLISAPIASIYGIFTYICHKCKPNVGKYTIHGLYGTCFLTKFLAFTARHNSTDVGLAIGRPDLDEEMWRGVWFPRRY